MPEKNASQNALQPVKPSSPPPSGKAVPLKTAASPTSTPPAQGSSVPAKQGGDAKPSPAAPSVQSKPAVGLPTSATVAAQAGAKAVQPSKLIVIGAIVVVLLVAFGAFSFLNKAPLKPVKIQGKQKADDLAKSAGLSLKSLEASNTPSGLEKDFVSLAGDDPQIDKLLDEQEEISSSTGWADSPPSDDGSVAADLPTPKPPADDLKLPDPIFIPPLPTATPTGGDKGGSGGLPDSCTPGTYALSKTPITVDQNKLSVEANPAGSPPSLACGSDFINLYSVVTGGASINTVLKVGEYVAYGKVPGSKLTLSSVAGSGGSCTASVVIMCGVGVPTPTPTKETCTLKTGQSKEFGDGKSLKFEATYNSNKIQVGISGVGGTDLELNVPKDFGGRTITLKSLKQVDMSAFEGEFLISGVCPASVTPTPPTDWCNSNTASVDYVKTLLSGFGLASSSPIVKEVRMLKENEHDLTYTVIGTREPLKMCVVENSGKQFLLSMVKDKPTYLCRQFADGAVFNCETKESFVRFKAAEEQGYICASAKFMRQYSGATDTTGYLPSKNNEFTIVFRSYDDFLKGLSLNCRSNSKGKEGCKGFDYNSDGVKQNVFNVDVKDSGVKTGVLQELGVAYQFSVVKSKLHSFIPFAADYLCIKYGEAGSSSDSEKYCKAVMFKEPYPKTEKGNQILVVKTKTCLFPDDKASCPSNPAEIRILGKDNKDLLGAGGRKVNLGESFDAGGDKFTLVSVGEEKVGEKIEYYANFKVNGVGNCQGVKGAADDDPRFTEFIKQGYSCKNPTPYGSKEGCFHGTHASFALKGSGEGWLIDLLVDYAKGTCVVPNSNAGIIRLYKGSVDDEKDFNYKPEKENIVLKQSFDDLALLFNRFDAHSSSLKDDGLDLKYGYKKNADGEYVVDYLCAKSLDKVKPEGDSGLTGLTGGNPLFSKQNCVKGKEIAITNDLDPDIDCSGSSQAKCAVKGLYDGVTDNICKVIKVKFEPKTKTPWTANYDFYTGANKACWYDCGNNDVCEEKFTEDKSVMASNKFCYFYGPGIKRLTPELIKTSCSGKAWGPDGRNPYLFTFQGFNTEALGVKACKAKFVSFAGQEGTWYWVIGSEKYCIDTLGELKCFGKDDEPVDNPEDDKPPADKTLDWCEKGNPKVKSIEAKLTEGGSEITSGPTLTSYKAVSQKFKNEPAFNMPSACKFTSLIGKDKVKMASYFGEKGYCVIQNFDASKDITGIADRCVSNKDGSSDCEFCTESNVGASGSSGTGGTGSGGSGSGGSASVVKTVTLDNPASPSFDFGNGVTVKLVGTFPPNRPVQQARLSFFVGGKKTMDNTQVTPDYAFTVFEPSTQNNVESKPMVKITIKTISSNAPSGCQFTTGSDSSACTGRVVLEYQVVASAGTGSATPTPKPLPTLKPEERVDLLKELCFTTPQGFTKGTVRSGIGNAFRLPVPAPDYDDASYGINYLLIDADWSGFNSAPGGSGVGRTLDEYVTEKIKGKTGPDFFGAPSLTTVLEGPTKTTVGGLPAVRVVFSGKHRVFPKASAGKPSGRDVDVKELYYYMKELTVDHSRYVGFKAETQTFDQYLPQVEAAVKAMSAKTADGCSGAGTSPGTTGQLGGPGKASGTTQQFTSPTVSSNGLSYYLAVTPKNSYADPDATAAAFCQGKGFSSASEWVAGLPCGDKKRQYFYTPGKYWTGAGETNCMASITCAGGTGSQTEGGASGVAGCEGTTLRVERGKPQPIPGMADATLSVSQIYQNQECNAGLYGISLNVFNTKSAKNVPYTPVPPNDRFSKDKYPSFVAGSVRVTITGVDTTCDYGTTKYGSKYVDFLITSASCTPTSGGTGSANTAKPTPIPFCTVFDGEEPLKTKKGSYFILLKTFSGASPYAQVQVFSDMASLKNGGSLSLDPNCRVALEGGGPSFGASIKSITLTGAGCSLLNSQTGTSTTTDSFKSYSIKVEKVGESIKASFTPAIQVCTDATPSARNALDFVCTESYFTPRHKLKVRLFGAEWILYKMDNFPVNGGITSSTELVLGKEVAYQEFMQPGDEITTPNGDKFKLKELLPPRDSPRGIYSVPAEIIVNGGAEKPC